MTRTRDAAGVPLELRAHVDDRGIAEFGDGLGAKCAHAFQRASEATPAFENVDLRPSDHAIDADERQLAEQDARARLAATAEDKDHVALRRQERASPGGEVASTWNVDRARNEALREISGGAGIQNGCGALAECRR